MIARAATTCCLACMALALLACARSESTQDASNSVGATIDQRARDQAVATARRESDMRKAGELGRASAEREIERSNVAEARRQANN